VAGSTIYVGGNFNQIGGATRRGIAALNATSGKLTAFNPGTVNNNVALNAPGVVTSIVLTPSAILVGGGFTNIAGAARTSVAAITPAGHALPWNPDANINVTDVQKVPSAFVDAIDPTGSTVLIGGYFASLGSIPQDGFGEFPAP
jgi:hypothetical protein